VPLMDLTIRFGIDKLATLIMEILTILQPHAVVIAVVASTPGFDSGM
jgi:hypothetical protein